MALLNTTLVMSQREHHASPASAAETCKRSSSSTKAEWCAYTVTLIWNKNKTISYAILIDFFPVTSAYLNHCLMHNLICRACSCNLSSPLLTPPPPCILINKIVFLSKNSLSGLLYSWGCQRSDHPHQSSWTQIFVPPASINTWISVSVWPLFQTVPSSAFCKKAMCRSRPLAWRRQLNSFEISDSDPGPCHPLCWIKVTFTIHLFMPWLTIQINFFHS